MNKYGLIGFPLGHSFSAKYFNNKFKQESIDAEYLNFEIENIEDIVKVLDNTENLKGLNVTIPHKETVIPFLDSLSTSAQKIGAVNTIKVIRYHNNGTSYKLEGHNTDYVGFKKSIQPLINPHTHTKALVLGTGGASKAIVQALEDMNIEWLYVSRTKGNNCITYNDIDASIMDDYKVIINCSPLGTFPKTDECPNLPYHLITKEHLLYDLVYNPAETLFLYNGKKQGATIKNGEEMLELQALAAWEIWER